MKISLYHAFMNYDNYGSKSRETRLQRESLEGEREASMAAGKITVILVKKTNQNKVNKTPKEMVILVISQGAYVTQEHKALRKNLLIVLYQMT